MLDQLAEARTKCLTQAVFPNFLCHEDTIPFILQALSIKLAQNFV